MGWKAVLPQEIYMTLRDAETLAHRLADQIRPTRPDLLVGIANGAWLPTKIVAKDLQVPFEVVTVRRRITRYRQKAFAILSAVKIPVTIFHKWPLRYFTRRMQTRYGDLEQTGGLDFAVRDKHIVVVDDAVHTGSSARHVYDLLRANGATKVTIAVLDWYKGIGDSGQWAPDIYLQRTNGQWFPWSYNSPYRDAYLAWLSANGGSK